MRLEHIEPNESSSFQKHPDSVQSHAYQTYISLDKLANILDYILYESGNKFVSPKEELDFAMNLIEINKIKINPLFDFRIKTKINKEDQFIRRKFLPLISVDLIENALNTQIFWPRILLFPLLVLDDGTFEMKVSIKFSEKTPLQKENSGFGSSLLTNV
jgi:hypothetical protein